LCFADQEEVQARGHQALVDWGFRRRELDRALKADDAHGREIADKVTRMCLSGLNLVATYLVVDIMPGASQQLSFPVDVLLPRLLVMDNYESH
jgi:hypothetical protein